MAPDRQTSLARTRRTRRAGLLDQTGPVMPRAEAAGWTCQTSLARAPGGAARGTRDVRGDRGGSNMIERWLLGGE